jgi:hypothetical protein
MASVISAAKTKFAALTAANFPSAAVPAVYLDEPPQASAGSQIRPPYAVLRDGGESPANVFEQSVIETTTFTLTLYYGTLLLADAAALAVRRNGGTAQQKLGFDFGTLSGLPTGFTLKSLVRTGSRRYYAGVAQDVGRVYAVELTYEATVQA